jgi:hypothetical protein
MDDSAPPPVLETVAVRAALSPIFGVAIPASSGLVTHGRHGLLGLLASYAYFSLVAFVIWEGNRRWYFRVERPDDWLVRPRRRLVELLCWIVVFTVPMSVILLGAWQQVTGDPGRSRYALVFAVLLIVSSVAIVTHVYETAFLVRAWESDRLKSASLEQARLRADLERLIRDVDPHFLFNSLHALVHLIETRSAHAVPFTQALAESYRYVLETRDQPLVPLACELAALERHHLLTSLRYGRRVSLTVDVPADDAASTRITPVTLPELLTNAAKHNDGTADDPVPVTIWIERDSLVMENARRPRATTEPSTGTGLENLSARCQHVAGRPLRVIETPHTFRVVVPVLKQSPDGPGVLPGGWEESRPRPGLHTINSNDRAGSASPGECASTRA